ncbi:MAG: prepilin-type N-terminal cleavage/methylation domain-containing protein [Acidobacteriota bacterium]|nr:prepilin-type N-terminal cleavage/methylation domain-containing protein [Acidobacteriota bacterium]
MHKLKTPHSPCPEGGFSLIELMLAMMITLVVMVLASTLLAGSFRVRSREDRRSLALADAQRALNIMTREIANTGFRLPPDLTYASGAAQIALPVNGIIPINSNLNSIRIIANLDDPGNGAAADPVVGPTEESEDVRFAMAVNNGSNYLARYDNNVTNNKTTVLADAIDSLNFYYYDERVRYTAATDANGRVNGTLTGVLNAANAAEAEVAPALAKYIVIVVRVRLPAVGTPNAEGYQPESNVQLVSDVGLRNTTSSQY